MKVTSEDIRNLAEALSVLQKDVCLNTHAMDNLRDCISMAIESFKDRLIWEGAENDD